MTARPITDPVREAQAFRIWREGRSVGWVCTCAELAEATGLSVRRVENIVAERGWPAEVAARADNVKTFGPDFHAKWYTPRSRLAPEQPVDATLRAAGPELLALGLSGQGD